MASSESATILQRLEQLHPKLIDLSLGRIERLAAALGSPHEQLPPVIHVAGTNGKGSVIAYLKAMLEAAGLRVHVYTSPHLRDFSERICLAGPEGAQPIAEDALSELLERVERANAGEPITFFEITTAAAFLAFAENPADVVILETGLGGRLDATNIVRSPALTLITPVSIDHADFLGDTIPQIAAEKAGIIKPGVPCVVARQPDEALDAIVCNASDLRAPILAGGSAWDAYEQHGRLVFQDENELIDLPLPRLIGRHQIENAGIAVAAVRNLPGFEITESDIAKGLNDVSWPARLQRLGPGALHALTFPNSELWLDGGHNPSAAQALAGAMAELEERVPCPLHLIIGMMSNKNAAAFLAPFAGLTEFVATVAIPGQPNAYTAGELSTMARHQGLFAEPARDLEDAFNLSRSVAQGPVRILMTGSLYFAGKVLEAHQHGLARI
ncbi:dihydrofolate synthase/folylpolyglutamate synthase [Dichotomicrobium thermohalophilum]|uniref:Dihydrofolate synthase/folylpolyglutamate synthase n=1 Tax=Dichotomicrobium thermohalophilum TaxID=933063 RepID=A0A397Q5S2_9HYPH|nr:dihydrofolate synthase/folylpolyglutamate synthase [Dichotomicrobium thermohalophilum]